MSTRTQQPQTAELLGIATHQQSRGHITEHKQAQVSVENGLNDYRSLKSANTAITVLSLAAWQAACNEAGTNLHWIQRRAQLLLDQLDFSEESVGKQLKIGKVILEVTAETDPCNRMEALHSGLKSALSSNWRGGVRCKVIKAGSLALGDKAQWL